MRKGIDHALFRKVVVDKISGEIVSDKLVMTRPAHGVKVLKARKAARKVARASRRRNRA